MSEPSKTTPEERAVREAVEYAYERAKEDDIPWDEQPDEAARHAYRAGRVEKDSLKKLLREWIDRIDKAWSFNEHQWYTLTRHDKQVCLEAMRKELAALEGRD